MNFQHSQLSKNVFAVNIKYKQNKDWEFWFLLTSDQHWDNPHSDHDLQLKHLELARERQAGIMSAGDYFCLMQGKYDKRSSKSSLRPEHQVDNYLDAVIKTGADFLEPYAKNFVCIATGNHESAIQKRHETNIIDRFCGVLNDRTGSTIHNGGYSGYIIFKFEREVARAGDKYAIALRYEHGASGTNPMTGGKGIHYPDCEIIFSGHTHDSWIREFGRQRLDKNKGATRLDVQTHIKCASYKDEFQEGFGGWATSDAGIPPKPIGAWWLRFFYEKENKTRPRRICYEVIKAS